MLVGSAVTARLLSCLASTVIVTVAFTVTSPSVYVTVATHVPAVLPAIIVFPDLETLSFSKVTLSGDTVLVELSL